jgi:hypothetical protein
LKKFLITGKKDFYYSRNFAKPEIQIFCNQENSLNQKNRPKHEYKFREAKKTDKTEIQKLAAVKVTDPGT